MCQIISASWMSLSPLLRADKAGEFVVLSRSGDNASELINSGDIVNHFWHGEVQKFFSVFLIFFLYVCVKTISSVAEVNWGELPQATFF